MNEIENLFKKRKAEKKKMAKKKPMFGVNNYHKRTPKKRPGQHAKSYSKRKPYVRSIAAKGGNVLNFMVDNYIFWVDIILFLIIGFGIIWRFYV